jgi:hypothetical protein
VRAEFFEDEVYQDEHGTWWTMRNGGRVPTTVTKPSDPAYALLTNPNIYSTPNLDIFRDDCYICLDPEFAAMGLPLCKACEECGGHIAADDSVCENGHDGYASWLASQNKD